MEQSPANGYDTEPLKVKIVLRPTVSGSLCLGARFLSGAPDQIFLTVRQ
jgi:hypothetical protein